MAVPTIIFNGYYLKTEYLSIVLVYSSKVSCLLQKEERDFVLIDNETKTYTNICFSPVNKLLSSEFCATMHIKISIAYNFI